MSKQNGKDNAKPDNKAGSLNCGCLVLIAIFFVWALFSGGPTKTPEEYDAEHGEGAWSRREYEEGMSQWEEDKKGPF